MVLGKPVLLVILIKIFFLVDCLKHQTGSNLKLVSVFTQMRLNFSAVKLKHITQGLVCCNASL